MKMAAIAKSIILVVLLNRNFTTSFQFTIIMRDVHACTRRRTTNKTETTPSSQPRAGAKIYAGDNSHHRPSSSLFSWNAEIDYSAANEYILAHYGGDQENPYFSHHNDYGDEDSYLSRKGVRGRGERGNEIKSGSRSKTVEKVYNARHGIVLDDDHNRTLHSTGINNGGPKPNLRQNGFVLHHSPTNVTDFHNSTMVQSTYTKELYHLLQQEFEKHTHHIPLTRHHGRRPFITHVAFWNPMIRGNEYNITRPNDNNAAVPTASVANMVHIDTDVGAYSSIREFVDLIEKNSVYTYSNGHDLLGQQQGDHEQYKDENCGGSYNSADEENYKQVKFPTEEIIELLAKGHRFAIINFWRNIRSEPIVQSPLGLLHAKYSAKKDHLSYETGSHVHMHTFPYAAPDMSQSKWYTFPQMNQDECLLFYQYDRLSSQPSDLWHCALNIMNTDAENDTEMSSREIDICEHYTRKSFDIRAFVLFDEIVPPEFDRFYEDRLRPFLNLQESGCFCDEQAAKRNSSKNNTK